MVSTRGGQRSRDSAFAARFHDWLDGVAFERSGTGPAFQCARSRADNGCDDLRGQRLARIMAGRPVSVRLAAGVRASRPARLFQPARSGLQRLAAHAYRRGGAIDAVRGGHRSRASTVEGRGSSGEPLVEPDDPSATPPHLIERIDIAAPLLTALDRGGAGRPDSGTG